MSKPPEIRKNKVKITAIRKSREVTSERMLFKLTPFKELNPFGVKKGVLVGAAVDISPGRPLNWGFPAGFKDK